MGEFYLITILPFRYCHHSRNCLHIELIRGYFYDEYSIVLQLSQGSTLTIFVNSLFHIALVYFISIWIFYRGGWLLLLVANSYDFI